MSDTVSEPSCVYWIVPSPLFTKLPLVGPLIISIDVRSSPSSASESFNVRSVVFTPPSATVSASSTATYIWDFGNGTVVSGTGQGPYQIFWATGGTKNISLQVIDSGYTSTVTTNLLIADSLPVISLPTDYYQCPGDFTSITASVSSGAPPYNYNWSQGGTTPNIIV